jgi:hypothetical protein
MTIGTPGPVPGGPAASEVRAVLCQDGNTEADTRQAPGCSRSDGHARQSLQHLCDGFFLVDRGHEVLLRQLYGHQEPEADGPGRIEMILIGHTLQS